MHTIMYLHLSECVHVVFSCHGERHDYDIQGYVFPSFMRTAKVCML